MLTSSILLQRLYKKKITTKDTVSEVYTKVEFRHMSSEMPLSEASRVLEAKNYILVDKQNVCSPHDILYFM